MMPQSEVARCGAREMAGGHRALSAMLDPLPVKISQRAMSANSANAVQDPTKAGREDHDRKQPYRPPRQRRRVVSIEAGRHSSISSAAQMVGVPRCRIKKHQPDTLHRASCSPWPVVTMQSSPSFRRESAESVLMMCPSELQPCRVAWRGVLPRPGPACFHEAQTNTEQIRKRIKKRNQGHPLILYKITVSKGKQSFVTACGSRAPQCQTFQ